MGFSLIATSWGYSVAVSGLLTAVAYLTAEHVLRGTRAAVLAAHGLSSAVPRLLEHRLSSCGTDLAACGSSQIRDRTCLLHWQADFFTTEPSGKPLSCSLKWFECSGEA